MESPPRGAVKQLHVIIVVVVVVVAADGRTEWSPVCCFRGVPSKRADVEAEAEVSRFQIWEELQVVITCASCRCAVQSALLLCSRGLREGGS